MNIPVSGDGFTRFFSVFVTFLQSFGLFTLLQDREYFKWLKNGD